MLQSFLAVPFLAPLVLPQLLLLQRSLWVLPGEADLPRQLRPHPRVRPQLGLLSQQGQHLRLSRIRPRTPLLRRRRPVSEWLDVIGFAYVFHENELKV